MTFTVSEQTTTRCPPRSRQSMAAHGTLIHTPAANAFRLGDGCHGAVLATTGGTADGGVDTRGAADLQRSRWTAVNDAPRASRRARTRTVLEDAAVGSASRVGSDGAHAPGRADEAGQVVELRRHERQRIRVCSLARPAVGAERDADLHAGGERATAAAIGHRAGAG